MNSKKVKFFIIHLSASFTISMIIIGFVFFIWFPAPLAKAEGVTHIFLMLIAIDVIVGPVLTLLVYKEGKKTLKMDLSIIVFVQIIALSYGLYSITQSRPVWIAQNGDIFQLVRANAIDGIDRKEAKPEYQQNGWFKPVWVAVDDKNKKYERYAEQTLVPNLYTDLSHAVSRIQKNAQPLDKLNEFNNLQQVRIILQENPKATAWMPLRTTGLGCVVLVNSISGEIIKVVDLRPWKE